MASKNTAEVWDNLWQGITSEQLRLMVEEESYGIRWQRIKQLVEKSFRDFRGLKTVEIGAGTGTFSVLMAKEGGQPTIIDYSQNALDASKAMFQLHDVKASYLQQDALLLPDRLHNIFDVSMSFGTAEHFKGSERVQFIKSHIDLIRPGGIAIISVPNAWNLPYRLWKWKLEKQGRWTVGEEYPFTRRELLNICNKYGWKEPGFLADSLISSFRYVNFLHPARIARRFLKLPQPVQISQSAKRRLERGTPLDEYLSYALTLCVKKAA